METKLKKFFAVLLLFLVCNTGNAGHCSLSDLVVTQTVLPGKIRYQRVFTVTVQNHCMCTQSNIKVTCRGFASYMGVDPAILRPDSDGNLCTLNNGGAVGKGAGNTVTFRYATNFQIRFKPVSSTITCS